MTGTDAGTQFPYPSDVYPLGHYGEVVGGLMQPPKVSRTIPSEHEIGSNVLGTGESD